ARGGGCDSTLPRLPTRPQRHHGPVRYGLQSRRHSSEHVDAEARRAVAAAGDQRLLSLRDSGHPLTRTSPAVGGSEHGIRLWAGAVSLMRPFALLVLVISPALIGGRLAAQAVERTDVPERGMLRVTFDPRIMTWNDEFTPTGRKRLGF